MLTTKSLPAYRPLPPDTRKPRSSFARAAGSFIPKLTAKAFERFGFHNAELLTAWPVVAGPALAAICTPERLKWRGGGKPGARTGTVADGDGATLFLRVSPAHALDVEYRAREIIDRINRYFGYRAVYAIKIVQAPFEIHDPQAPPAGPRPVQDINPAVDPETLDGALARLAQSVTSELGRRFDVKLS